jgi:hypothetical protein
VLRRRLAPGCQCALPSLLTCATAIPDRARADIAELTGLFETGRLRIAATTLPLAEAV